MRLIRLASILIIGLASGCAGYVRAPMVSPTPTVASAPGSEIVTSLYRLGTVRVPIAPQGATLRSVLADARDLASQGGGIVFTHAINDPDVFKDLMSADQDANYNLRVGEECVVVSRGDSRIIVPDVLATSTAMGSLRLTSDDMVQTVPITFLNSLSETSGGTIAIASNHFDARTITVNDKTTLNQVSNLAAWDKAPLNLGAPPALNPELLRPNVATISRIYDGINHLLILPCDVAEARDVGSELMHLNLLKLLTQVTFANGDIVNFTRLENIPAVALGLSLPVPPHTTVAAPAAAKVCSATANQACMRAGQTFPPLAAGARTLQQCTQTVTGSAARLCRVP